jgi:single-strand selective monofunctional uracil DNA glycosylase
MDLIGVSAELSGAVERLTFAAPVAVVYNPLAYARSLHEAYLHRFGTGRGQVILLGMNPGPWGMAQTGVPFGEVAAVRDWMGLAGEVETPRHEHPKRPIQGLACQRSEVSGRRLWGWAAERFGSPEEFFARFFVANYCPLSFMEEGGRNRTPDKLPTVERAPLFAACDRALQQTVDLLEPTMVVGVGAFAEACARRVLADRDVAIGRVLHPSPASPVANRGWAERAEKDLRALGIEF